MKKLLALMPLLILSGCSTITRGTTQAVLVVTPGAEGASCRLFSPSFGERELTSPGSVVVEKSTNSISVTCKKRCFNDGSGLISSQVEVMTAGNLVFGGVIGLGVDAATGAMNKYDAQTQVIMTPIPGCRA